MKWQNKIIGGCYLYISGIVLAMLLPLDSAWLPLIQAGAALALGLAGLLIIWALLQGDNIKERAHIYSRYLWPMLAIGAVLFGYGRYTSANTVPDLQIGEIQLAAGALQFEQTVDLQDTSRIRLHKTQELASDLQVRVVGELAARLPVIDDEGQYLMDADARWKFTKAVMPMQSEVITISADDPVGTDYVVDQPFSRIDGVELVAGPAEGAVAVYRMSNHIGSFVRPARAQSPVIVLGRITSDPRVYDFKTVLMITPSFVQFPAGGPFYRVEGGDIQVTIHPDLEGYSKLARTAAYGADVQIQGDLTVARMASNPGGFNARQFMQNYNIYGLMSPFQPRGEPPPMRMVRPEGADEPRTGHGLVAFSLDLRDRVLLLFKSTMPYPQSAFLGGVTLGLRYGLQGAQFPGEQERGPWATRLGMGASEAQIADDFRHAGVNHVLAVSGLHVTILTVMFIAIFALMKFPKQVFVPFVIFALVVFAIITGARPSTLRAVIMNSLFLLTWAYLDKGLLSSVLIGVPVAAFLILVHNPLVVVDPSFTLSFMAILSLALITVPMHDMLSHLRGNRFLVVVVFVFATTVSGIVNWHLVTTLGFILPWLIFGIVTYQFAKRMDLQGWGIPKRFAFAALPEGVSTFIAAQVAIQIGMMVPLSAYYFARWPFAGAYANLVAIPLIGVVVQLGAIGGLLGLIPIVGPYITLLLNAANWIFASFFLWLAHVSALIFPNPFVRRPRVIEIVVYYAFIAAFIWHKPLWKWIKATCATRRWTHRYAPAGFACVLVAIALLPLGIAPPRDTRPEGLHVTVLSVGYGSSILVESPSGKRILVDTGFVEHERGRRNEAIRTIMPYFSHAAIRRLDGLIITSPLSERAAGAAYILDHMRVAELILPPMLGGLNPDLSFEEFAALLGPAAHIQYRYPAERIERMYEDLVGNKRWPRRLALAPMLQARGPTQANQWSGRALTTRTAALGDVLFEETVDGQMFRIEVLAPDPRPVERHIVENNGLALRVVYGDFAMLIPGAMQYEGQQQLAEAWHDDQLRSQIIVVPHQGAANPTNVDRPDRVVVRRALDSYVQPLLDRVQPEVAIFEFGNPRPVLDMAGRTAINLLDITRLFYSERLGAENILSTDRDMAISIYSDGQTFAIETQAQRNRAQGGEDDAVSDLQVGL